MYSWPDLPESYWQFWGTEPHRKGVERRTLLMPDKPRAWFFGDSFVQEPSKNIWHPIANEFNPVHRGIGASGIEQVYTQLLICKDLILPEDRVVITISHHDREIGKNGIRLAAVLERRERDGSVAKVKGIRQYAPVSYRGEEEYQKFIDPEFYEYYIKEVRWDLQHILKYMAMLQSIEKIIIPSLKTNYVALFNCFGDKGFSKFLLKYNVPPDTIKELTQSIQDPMWDFVMVQEGLLPNASFEEIGARRSATANHFFDEDVVPFWNHYKGTLQRLCLDSPPYK
jgi:hypothetical protein